MRSIQDTNIVLEKMTVSQRSEIEKMFLKHYKDWCLLSYRYMENMPEAEDIVQDVFVNIQNNMIINYKPTNSNK